MVISNCEKFINCHCVYADHQKQFAVDVCALMVTCLQSLVVAAQIDHSGIYACQFKAITHIWNALSLGSSMFFSSVQKSVFAVTQTKL